MNQSAIKLTDSIGSPYGIVTNEPPTSIKGINAMALLNCKECGKALSDKARVCPHCGAPFESDKVSVWIWIALSIFALVVAAVWWSGPMSKEESDSRDAIAKCWKMYEKQSLTPSEKVGVARVCEELEKKLALRLPYLRR